MQQIAAACHAAGVHSLANPGAAAGAALLAGAEVGARVPGAEERQDRVTDWLLRVMTPCLATPLLPPPRCVPPARRRLLARRRRAARVAERAAAAEARQHSGASSSPLMTGVTDGLQLRASSSHGDRSLLHPAWLALSAAAAEAQEAGGGSEEERDGGTLLPVQPRPPPSRALAMQTLVGASVAVEAAEALAEQARALCRDATHDVTEVRVCAAATATVTAACFAALAVPAAATATVGSHPCALCRVASLTQLHARTDGWLLAHTLAEVDAWHEMARVMCPHALVDRAEVARHESLRSEARRREEARRAHTGDATLTPAHLPSAAPPAAHAARHQHAPAPPPSATSDETLLALPPHRIADVLPRAEGGDAGGATGAETAYSRAYDSLMSAVMELAGARQRAVVRNAPVRHAPSQPRCRLHSTRRRASPRARR